ncbi:MAG TPA: hypothetical protein VMG12_24315 [Polyangiaceae bacterium]|nr:hypothetical protein [Polyangiaceae bacterium]
MTDDDERALDALLAPAKGFLEPQPTDAARVLHGLRRALDAGEGAPAPEPRAPVSAVSFGVGKVAGIAVLAAAIGFYSGFSFGRHGSEPALASLDSSRSPALESFVDRVELPEPPASNAATQQAGSSPEALEIAPAREAPAPRARAHRKIASADADGPAQAANTEMSLAQALELLQRARAAQSAGQPSAALLLLSELDRRAPRDMLTEERLLAQVLSWCDLDNRAEAQRSALALREQNPSSIYSRRLAESCVSDATRDPAHHERR